MVNELREHILWTAKDVFLEMGFERASMDVVGRPRRDLEAHPLRALREQGQALPRRRRARRAGSTSTGSRRQTTMARTAPRRSCSSAAASCRSCCYRPALQTCRLFIAEAERHPEASARYYDAIFATPHRRLAAFLSDRYALTPQAAGDIAGELLGRMTYPLLLRALHGLDELLTESPDEAAIAADVDLAPIRRAVAALLPSAAV